MTYLATVNTPGYLAEDMEPATFDTAREAWDHLADDRKRHEEDFADMSDGYTSVVNKLECASNGVLGPDDLGLDHDLTGTIFGPTPGYTGNHDLGLAYTVSDTAGLPPHDTD